MDLLALDDAVEALRRTGCIGIAHRDWAGCHVRADARPALQIGRGLKVISFSWQRIVDAQSELAVCPNRRNGKAFEKVRKRIGVRGGAEQRTDTEDFLHRAEQ